MSVLIEFLEKIVNIDGVVAAIVAGIFTFWITKYTYHKNVPLDEFEKAYNRVYYPISRLIRSDRSVVSAK